MGAEATQKLPLKLSFSVMNGYDVIKNLKSTIAKYDMDKPRKYKVQLVYEILSGRDRKYFRSNTFRSQVFIDSGERVLYEVENFIENKGEIYFPESPYNLDFVQLHIWIDFLVFPHSISAKTHKSSYINAEDGLFMVKHVSGLLEGIDLFYNPASQGLYHRKIPNFLFSLGIQSITQFERLDINDQIEICNNYFRNNRKSRAKLKHPIVLTTKENISQLSSNELLNKIHVFIDAGLYVVTELNLSNIELHSREIKLYQPPEFLDAIYVIYDTEWNWKASKKVGEWEVEEPLIVTYCVINCGKLISESQPDIPILSMIREYNYNPSYIVGEGCMIKFLDKLVELSHRLRHKKLYVIAHNAAKCEHIFIINAITKWFSNTPNYSIEFTHTSNTNVYTLLWRNIEFRDSFLFLAFPLKVIGEFLQLKNRKMEFSYEDIPKVDSQRLINTRMEELSVDSLEYKFLRYALMDVVVLGEAILTLCVLLSKSLNLPLFNFLNFRSASSIVKWWLFRGEEKIGWDSLDISSLRNIIYHGGRTECCFIGTSEDFKFSSQYYKLYKEQNLVAINIDIVSSYPHSMTVESLPGEPIEVLQVKNIEELDRLVSDSNHIYLIFGNLKQNQEYPYPIICVKERDKLIFPNFMTGTRRVSMWGFEFLEIREYIESIDKCEVIKFTKYDKIRDKIKSLYMRRREAILNNNHGLSLVYKILMNSGYGSIGLNPEREVAYLVKGTFYNRITRFLTKYVEYEGPNGFKWICYKRKVEVNTKICMVSYITALSRHLLYKELRIISSNKKNIPLYYDTDSIFFNTTQELVDHYKTHYKGDLLGSWKYELSETSWEICSPKVYRIGNKIRYKGITTGLEQLDENGKISKTIKMEIWGIDRQGKLTLREVTKRMSFKYTKGIVLTSSFTKPFIY